jgi:glycosyltransferase involved in cell wall biosynthesis
MDGVMTRVVLIHQAFASPGEAGGTRHYELARYCVEQGHTFTIIASQVSYLTGQRVGEREQNLDGIRVRRAYAYPALHRSFMWRIVSFLSFMLSSIWTAWRSGPVDVVMGTTPPIFQAVSAWVVAWLRRRPFLLEVRDLWPEFAIGMGVLRNPVLIKLSRWLEGFLYARATHLLVNSPAYRDYLIGKRVPAHKISLIANGVDPEMFDPEADGAALRQTWQLAGKFVVTYAGALGLANDIPTLLQAAAQVRDQVQIHFLLVGDGKERTALEAQVRQMNLTNVMFTGPQPKAAMREVLALSDVCVAILQDIPMFRTTYPNKVFDYMAAGRPTVLAIDGVIREVIEAAQGGLFVPPGDAAALARAVLQLSTDQAQARAMGRAARAYVVEHFNRQQQAADFVSLLQRVAAH